MTKLRMLPSLLAGMALFVLLGGIGLAQRTIQEWITWNGDQERTGWAKAETAFTKDTVGKLELKWKTQLDTPPSAVNYYMTLTDPLVVSGVTTAEGPKTMVFVAGRTDTVYAIDADSGKVAWQRRFANPIPQPHPPFTSCPNDLNATPAIDKEKGIIYVLNTDGKLRGLSLSNGEDRIPPTDFTAPYARTWSLNLIDGILYTSVARGCGNTIAHFVGMDLNDTSRKTFKFYTSTGRPAGAWGRGGLVKGPKGVYTQTADGAYDPAAGRFGNTVLALTKELQLTDSYTPANYKWLNQKDLDLGSASPVVFPFGKWTLLAVAGKEGVVYLLDANNLGGENHQTPLFVSPRFGNDAVTFGFTGVWGAMSSYQDAAGRRWLLVPMEGPVAKDAPKFEFTNGVVENGSVMALEVVEQGEKPVLVPRWVSRDLELPGIPAATTSGIVFALSTGERGRYQAATVAAREGREVAVKAGANAVGDLHQNWNADNKAGQGQKQDEAAKKANFAHAYLYALDGATGKELFNSGELLDSWNHYGMIAVANQRIYVSTWDARVYAFGVR
jgi:outer membrane protein assembly factor BamB